MRQIVFRGRCFNDPTWAYGLPYIERIDQNGETWVTMRQPRENQGVTIMTIDPDSIGQFTGLYDANKNPIFEGDIIQSFDSDNMPILHLVEYRNDAASFVAKLINGLSPKWCMVRCEISQDWINEFGKIIIGNSFDNPELLKGENP